jgi:hypothetical protein
MSLNPILNQRARQVLYALTREYGDGPLSLYTAQGATVNLETGAKQISKTVTVLKRVIVLPSTVKRDLVQTISMISANKQFVYGGTHDARERNFIIDRQQAPDLTIKDDDWLVFKGHKYEISKFQEFEYDSGWIITARELIGEVPEQIFLLQADHLLELDSDVDEELN